MSRQKIIFAFFCALFFLPLEAAYACSSPPPSVHILCGQANPLSVEYHRYVSTDAVDTDTARVIDLAARRCNTDLTAVAAQMTAVINDYLATNTGIGVGQMDITHSSPERVNAMRLHNVNLLVCEAYRYETIEGLLISYNYIPAYCGIEWLAFPLCSVPVHIELLPFLNFLVTNLTPTKLLYIGFFVLGLGTIIQLRQRQKLMQWFMPTAFVPLLCIVACPALFALSMTSHFWLDIGTLGWGVMVWCIVSSIVNLIKYLRAFLSHSETPV